MRRTGRRRASPSIGRDGVGAGGNNHWVMALF
jgi:hypothetical protein